MIQSCLSPAAGKRLIAKGLCAHPRIRSALVKGTIVILAGSTNGYVAEELLPLCDNADEIDFDRASFMRGATLPPGRKLSDLRSASDQPGAGFPGDLIIRHGKAQLGQTIFDVIEHLREGDVIIKGANALDPQRGSAAVLVGHPTGGTITAALQAVVGKRVTMLIPVGLEKRIHGDIDQLARAVNASCTQGPRLLPIGCGDVITEIDAIRLLFNSEAQLFAAGGLGGAEGSIWLGIDAGDEAPADMQEQLSHIAGEPSFA